MTVFRKLLIANRGEISARIGRTARLMGIRTVAVYSDADEGAPFVAAADEAVHLTGSSPADTYLRGDLIVEAATATGADAVHPGYGFLSENSGFAQMCVDAGLVFVGPPPSAIAAMASKIEAKRLMESAGVPILPGMVINEMSPDELLAQAARVGLPLIVKAAFGGGGRGMRIVKDADDLLEAVETAGREASSAFGDGTVFLEKYVQAPRHIEIQVFADRHGRAIHLFERECSIQRRHQKIIEESPSTAIDPTRRELMGAAAVTAAKAIGYEGAGTVEFVVDPDGNFYFLEVNTRLQVEHPVTEMVTGLDLVRLQLQVAAGLPLPDDALQAELHGHAIEARLYAEDVPAGFLPVSGRLHSFNIAFGDRVRVDSGYGPGSVVSTHYDAMLAKVIAWAPTRDEAIDTLADSLARAEIHGVVTNQALLVRALRSDDFVSGHTDTAFLERNDPAELGRPLFDPLAAIVHPYAAAALLIETAASSNPAPAGVATGWRNVGGGTAPIVFGLDGGTTLTVPGRIQEFADVQIVAVRGSDVTLDYAGVRRTCHVHHHDQHWWVDSVLGSTSLVEIDRFPVPGSSAVVGSLVAPMPGAVTSVRVAEGDRVESGQVVITIEAMKMEHSLRAPQPGTVVKVQVSEGQQVDNGAVLIIVDEDDHGARMTEV